MRVKGKTRFAYLHTTILSSDPGRIGRSGDGSAAGADVRIGEGRTAGAGFAIGAARCTVVGAWTLPSAASKKAFCAARASATERLGWAGGEIGRPVIGGRATAVLRSGEAECLSASSKHG